MNRKWGEKMGVKLSENGVWWIDENDNKWNINDFSKENAEFYSETLFNCQHCVDSWNLKHCISCIECSDCTDCDNCYKSSYLIECSDCVECTHLNDSSHCFRCHYGFDLKNAQLLY